MKCFAVIDTNVVVSSMLKANSIPGRIIDYIKTNTIIPLVNKEILDEYLDVLTRNEFDFDPIRIDKLIKIIQEKGITLNREQSLEDFIDEDDIVFLKS